MVFVLATVSAGSGVNMIQDVGATVNRRSGVSSQGWCGERLTSRWGSSDYVILKLSPAERLNT